MPQLPTKDHFHTISGNKQVTLHYLQNGNNMKAAITNYGARMVSLYVPGKENERINVIQGYQNIESYINGTETYCGAIVGRYANRIANGNFQLDGKSYELHINNPPNTLHGGPFGFHTKVWDVVAADEHQLVLGLFSPDGEEGYPGNLHVMVAYSLTDDDELKIEFNAVSDKKTVLNLCNHNYWNLNGEESGTIYKHELMLMAVNYTPVDATLIPAGVAPVLKTPFDFTSPKSIDKDLHAADLQLQYGGGYDHNFVLDKGVTETPEMAGWLRGNQSGITMEIHTTEPGIQLYTGNFLPGTNKLISGTMDDAGTALCLETQHFPDSPNHPEFPTTVLEAGEEFKSTTVYKFLKGE
ncbi:MAG: galactose mutarotase [Chitinophagaceae bacterium]|nr:galactose mutarotase [Chitinophagaceae bacterium]